MTAALIQQATNASDGSSVTVTLGTGVTTGRVIFLVQGEGTATSPSMSASGGGGTSIPANANNTGSDGTAYAGVVELYNVTNGTTSFTVTVSGTSNYGLTVVATEWSGLGAGTSSCMDTHTPNIATSSTVSAGSLTPGGADYLFLSNFAVDYPAGATLSSGPTNSFTEFTIASASTQTLVGAAYYIATDSSAHSTTWNISASTSWASIIVAFKSFTASAPSAPTLTAPANASYADVSSGITFSAVYNSTDGSTQNAYAMRIKVSGGTYNYWNISTSALQSTIVWNAGSVAVGASWSVAFGSSVLADGNIYNWSMASQESGAGVQGAFATDSTFTAQATPTLTVTGPSGTITGTTQPAVIWTESLGSGVSQTNYRVVVESGTYGTVPGSGASSWDSGVVSSAALNVQVGSPLTPNTTYRAFVQITETGALNSNWAYSTFTLQADAPATPILTGVAGNDPVTGAPMVTLTLQGTDNALTANQASLESGTTTGWAAT